MSADTMAQHDLLLAEYTLGLLNPQEMEKAHALLGENPDAVARAMLWEDRFLALVDQLPPIEPPAHLLQRIQAKLGMEITLVKRPNVWLRGVKKVAVSIWHGLWFWRVASAALLLAALAYAARPNLAVIAAPAIAEAAVLQAPGQSSTPGWVLTVDKGRNLLLKPEVHIDVPADASVQLWTHNDSAPQPRSLGVLEPNKPAKVSASTLGAIAPDQIFEMTLEAKKATPAAAPAGPVLFIGRLVTLGSQP